MKVHHKIYSVNGAFEPDFDDPESSQPSSPEWNNQLTVASLHQLAHDGNTEEIANIFRRLPSSAAAQRLIEQEDNHGLRPLHYAARARRLETAKLLVANGADVNARGRAGVTPLHSSARCIRLGVDHEDEETRTTPAKRRLPLNTRTSTGTSVTVISLQDDDAFIAGSALQASLPSKETDEFPTFVDSEESNVIAFLARMGADVTKGDDYAMRPLHYAAMRNNTTAVDELLKCPGIDVNAKDQDSMTALHTAAVFGAHDLIEPLLRAGCPFDTEDEQGRTTLHMAAHGGHKNVVQRLIKWSRERKISLQDFIMQRDQTYETALNLAIIGGYTEIARLLLENGADPTAAGNVYGTPLHAACSSNKLILVQLVLEHAVDVDARDAIYETPLHKTSNPDIMRLLVRRNASVDAANIRGDTPLIRAAGDGDVTAVECLLNLGAIVDAPDTTERTALFAAAKTDHRTVIEVLLENGAQVNWLDRNNDTALHVAAVGGNFQAAKILFEAGADALAKNHEENTPLHLAAQNDLTDLIKAILEYNFSAIDEEDESSNQPLHIAAQSGRERACEILIEMGSDLEARNQNLWTPLGSAAFGGSADATSLLLRKGALIDVADKARSTPLHLACRQGHLEVVHVLLEWNADPAAVDETDRNCLDYAIEANHPVVARSLLSTNHWKNLLRNRRVVNKVLITPLRQMISHMPDVASYVLDRCTSARGQITDENELSYEIEFDYEFVEDAYKVEIRGLEGYFSPWDEETGTLLPQATPFSAKIGKPSNHVLVLLADTGNESLATHPLVLSLLRHKWSGAAQTLYYFILALYAAFVMTCTVYATSSRPPYLAFNKAVDNSQLEPLNITCDEFIADRSDASYYSERMILYFFAPINIGREVYQFVVRRSEYLGFGNLLELFIYISTFLLVLELPGHCVVTDWQWVVGATGIGLAWLNLLLMLNKFPMLGVYMLMLQNVIRTFSQVLPIFFVFIVSFFVLFHMILQHIILFEDEFLGIARVIDMGVVGEFETDDTLFSPGDFFIPYPFVTFAGWTGVAILITIITMNLLIGLAVGDVKTVQEKAQMEKLRMQVDIVSEVTGSLPEGYRRRKVIQRQVIHPKQLSLATRIQVLLFGQSSILSRKFIAERWNQQEADVATVKATATDIQRRIQQLKESMVDSQVEMSNLIKIK